ncbi:MAG: ribosome-associated translation inhibitor RaiA [Coriobacteriia bacterium]|nr:ribosome-associated translation inhibitor RaiA [Coriobacteriia bacterium]
MQMIVKGRRMDVTPAIREYAEEKIGRVTKILNSQLMSAEVELYTERNKSIEKGQVAEVTVYTKGHVIRAKEAASDLFAAIDLVSEKLESQVRRYKDKTVDRHTKGVSAAAIAPAPAPEELDEPAIVKTKTLATKPMSTDEAILQMELLGHDFFVFRSEDTEGTNVLYRRNDGDYGLITSA